MHFFLILFFISLTAIILMIGRKWSLVKGNVGQPEEHHEAGVFISSIFDLDQIKHSLILNFEKAIHALIFVTLRGYLLSSNLINLKRKEWAEKIKVRLNKNRQQNIAEEKKEVSKYIRIISEYRQKIKHMKHKIKEEEGIE
jgi:hypothetical protein